MIQMAPARLTPAYVRKMARNHRAKYRPGSIIRSVAQLLRRIDRNQITYWRHKPQNAAWLMGMPYRTLRSAVRSGILRVAVRVEEL